MGKGVGSIFAILLGGSLLLSDFVPTDFALSLASATMTVYVTLFGSSFPFPHDMVGFFFLYLEAVVVTAFYFGFQALYRRHGNSETNERST
ncbi:hypothetical protein [Haladaptatus caseinilyticus]|uniref:hypothetical protein n=1 Tax=Haladaptatus caseinilyticus TaxID=2993314 RepID=UPI00224A5F0D|nr:hypothetical protein [Haladaptatus caseinilyticus]